MKYCLLVLFFVLTATAKAQTSWGDSVLPNQTIYTVVDKAPIFPGGLIGYYQFIANNLQLPDNSAAPFSGKPIAVRVLFDTTGKIVFARIEQSFTDKYNAAILKLISKMPNWTAGIKGGKAVPVSMKIPILVGELDKPVRPEPQ